MLAQNDHDHDHHHQHQLLMIKGKRTKRPRPTLTISTASGDESCRVATSSSTTTTATDTYNTSPIPTPTTTIINPTQEEEDMAHCLILLAQGATKSQKLSHTPQPETPAAAAAASVSPAKPTGLYVYECKTCNRCFPSFQALGGHRASHKKDKSPAPAISSPENQDCFRLSENSKPEELGLSLRIACSSSSTLSATSNNHNTAVVVPSKTSKVHACAICGAEFSSGQALGGHMRRHRPIVASGRGSPSALPETPPAPARSLLCLDLNLPAEEQEDQQQQQQQQQQAESAKFVFGPSGKTLVFAANSLVDCRY